MTDDSTSLCRCGRPKKDWATLCYRCYVDAQLQAARTHAFERGFREGYEKGREEARAGANGNPFLKLPEDRLRQLIHLCHPDRHDNSATANAVTQWLLGLRQARD